MGGKRSWRHTFPEEKRGKRMGSSYRKRKMRDKEDLIPLGSRENSNPNPNIKVLLRVRVCVCVWSGGAGGGGGQERILMPRG